MRQPQEDEAAHKCVANSRGDWWASRWGIEGAEVVEKGVDLQLLARDLLDIQVDLTGNGLERE